MNESVPVKKKYKKNFLSHVICKLDCRNLPEIDEDFIEKIRGKIKGEFPKIEAKKMFGIEAKFSPEKKLEERKIPESNVYILKDSAEKNAIIFCKEYFSIESKNYINFREFRKNIELTIDAFTSIVEDPDYTRLGLRFINQIVLNKGNPFIWTNYIASSLISPIDKFFVRSQNLARMMSQAVLNYDDYKVNFNYGIYNSEFPAKISRKEFVLDFDFYTEYVEQDTIIPLITNFDKESAIMFERCIRDGLRSIMGVIDE